MAKHPISNKTSAAIAAIVSSVLMLVFGLGFRVLAARLSAPVDTMPIDPEALQQLPLRIGDWTGQEVPLDEAIVRATDTDAHINRRYSRRSGLESALLYIASGVKARDLMPHRPEVCYTGAGWTLTNRQSVDLPLSNEMKLPCNILQFSRGTLDKSRVIVLDYYLVDGQYCRDVSLLRSKAWRGSGTVDYVAQVQIVTLIAPGQTVQSAMAILSDFAVASTSLIVDVFKGVVEDRSSDHEQAETNRLSKEPIGD
jgi:EpsI family protein